MRDLPFVNAAFYRWFPFSVFMAFVALEEFIQFSAMFGHISPGSTVLYYLYPIKTLVVACILWKFRREYRELSFRDLGNLPATVAVCGTGLLVYILWIQMDWTLGVMGSHHGFNPALLPGRGLKSVMILFKIIGSVLVVPIMEELFWRSFLIRYIITGDFHKVPLGAFTWPSFLLTVVLFGLEHHSILAGMMAGIMYNLVLYRTRSIAQCVLAHACTNLALATHVVFTGNWQHW